MKVFLSWSGESSRRLANVLYGWLPRIFPDVEPWESSTDILAGERWLTALGKQLEQSAFGIVCVTRESLKAPWLHFEAGALARSLTEARVVPLLLGVDHSDLLSGPLAQFQSHRADADGMRAILRSTNSFSGGEASQAVRRRW